MGWCRKSVNYAIGRNRRFFKHAVENELIDASVLQRLQAIAPLLAGRTEAHDNAPRTADSDADIEAVKPHVSPKIRDLIDLQRLTGARSGELLGLTTRAINRDGDDLTAYAQLGTYKAEIPSLMHYNAALEISDG